LFQYKVCFLAEKVVCSSLFDLSKKIFMAEYGDEPPRTGLNEPEDEAYLPGRDDAGLGPGTGQVEPHATVIITEGHAGYDPSGFPVVKGS
jgi:hypothetical protein